MNAQNLTFIKTQSFVTKIVPHFPHFPCRLIFSPKQQFLVLLILHVAHFKIIFNIGINLLYNVELRWEHKPTEKKRKHKNAFW